MITIYTNKFIPSNFAAITIGFICFMRPKYKDDIGLHEHEKTHVKQWIKYLFFGFWFLYLFNKNSRLKFELEAYQVQLKYNPESAMHFAKLISGKYGLDITISESYIKLIGA